MCVLQCGGAYIQSCSKNNKIYEKLVICLFMILNFIFFLEAIQVEEPRRTIPPIPTTSTSWLLVSFHLAAVITEPQSCGSHMDYSECSHRH